MKVKIYQIKRALRNTMAEHRWAKNMRSTFLKSFKYYLRLETK